MSEVKNEIATYFGRCRCCLSYGYLKNMWAEHQFEGETEIYGEMLVDCFALSWDQTEDSLEQDQICEQCVNRLRDACDFKKIILNSQEDFFQEMGDDKDAIPKMEDCDEGILMVYKGPESDTNDTADTADIDASVDETEYEDVEYLEDEVGGEAKEALVAGSSKSKSQPEPKRRRKLETQTDSDDGTKRKWPRRLPKSERFKTYKQYTEENLRQCLEAVRNGNITPNEAARKYNIPKKTICAKMKIEPKDVQIDNTTKSTNIHTLESKKHLMKRPTIFKKPAVDAKTKLAIERRKLKAKNLKRDIKNDPDDKDKITIEVNILPKDEEKDVPVDANQIRTRYKAIVKEIFKNDSREPEKSDVNEINKHKDNLRTILDNTNATIIKGYWGVGYYCSFCEEQRVAPSELKQHNLEMHTDVDEVIKVKYVSDLVIRLDITDLKCRICGDSIDSLEDVMEHLSKAHDKIIHTDIKNHIIPFKFDTDGLQCVICKKDFKYFKLLSEHMSEHYRNYECNVCDRAFINKQSMQTHSYRHKKGVFKCANCPKVFDSRPKRSVHERVVHALSNKTRKCAFCDERFSTKDLVQSHEVKVHGVEPTVFSCQACNKTYSSQSSLLTHRNRFHLMLRPHKCSYCEMAFFSKIELRSHMVTHTKSKDFKCNMCSKSFGTRCSLNQHVRGHLDDRRYKCENCERAFVHRTAWKVHMRSKHEEADSNREKTFRLIKEIKAILTYTNATPYKSKSIRYYCAYCSTDGPNFDDPDDLRSHTRTEHIHDRTEKIEYAMRPYWMNEVLKLDIDNLLCTVCCIVINNWNEMFKHLREKHNVHLDQAYTRVIPYVLRSELRCALCKESFSNYMHLDGHMNAHYNNYVCDDCGVTFLAQNRLKQHVKIHNIGKYSCSMCPKVFTLEKYRRKHEETVHKQLCKFKCLYCTEKFTGEYIRHLHCLEMHKDKIKPITCEQCGKVFTWRQYYMNHMKKKHDNIRNYECAECDKKFFSNYELKDHVLRHIGHKNYECEICHKKYFSMLALKQHGKQHKKDENM